MGITLAGFRPRRGLGGPISVVFSGVDHALTSNAQWSVVAPDPGALQVGDVVLVYLSVINGGEDGVAPGTNGWGFFGGDFLENAGRNYGSYLWVRRVASAGSIPVEQRIFSFFTNFVGSSTQLVIVVLRGVRNTGFISGDFDNRVFRTAVPPAAAAPLSQVRGGIGRLGISFGHTQSGSIGGPPPGWTSIVQQSNAAGIAYCEAQWFPAAATTSQSARSPSPTARGFGLVHAIAP